jgi:predicted small secreted protein
MVKVKVLVCSFIMGIALTACNTMEGVGKDVKGAGSSLEKAANKNKP